MERGGREQTLERLLSARFADFQLGIAHPLLVLELPITRFALVLVDRHELLLVAEAHNAHGQLAVNIYQLAAAENTPTCAKLEGTAKWAM